MRLRLRSRNARGRGQALVEFSLVLPIFMLVFLGIAEGGYYIVATTAVSHATQEGARYGILETTSDSPAVQTRVVDAAKPIVSLDTADVVLSKNGSACDPTCYNARVAGDRLGITTTYTHVPLVGYVFSGITFPANASAELLVE